MRAPFAQPHQVMAGTRRGWEEEARSSVPRETIEFRVELYRTSQARNRHELPKSRRGPPVCVKQVKPGVLCFLFVHAWHGQGWPISTVSRGSLTTYRLASGIISKDINACLLPTIFNKSRRLERKYSRSGRSLGIA